MNKKTTAKWFTGIMATVLAATFIGFVQMNQGEDESNPLSDVRGKIDLQTENIFRNGEDNHEEAEGYKHHEEYDEYDGDGDDNDDEYESSAGQEYQGMQKSDRRTSRS